MGSRYKWTNTGRLNKNTASRLGKYPYQFYFNEDDEVFHHMEARKRTTDFTCERDAMDTDSDMTFAAAIMDTLKGEKTPCPHCLPDFPTKISELKRSHIPEDCSLTFTEIKQAFR